MCALEIWVGVSQWIVYFPEFHAEFKLYAIALTSVDGWFRPNPNSYQINM